MASELSIAIAQLLAIIYIGAGLAGLINKTNYKKIMDGIFKQSALVYLSGMFALLIGGLLVIFHNMWVADWPVIITVIGWIGMLKGFILLAWPNHLKKMSSPLLSMKALPWFMLVLGLVFAYLGCFMQL